MTEQDRVEEAEDFNAAIEGPETEDTALVVASEGPARLLEIAVRQGLDMDKLERLVAMKERWDVQQVKVAFYDALAKFQKIVPVLEKRSKVSFGTTKYSFAPLPDIKAGIQDSLSECGLSYRWEFADNAGQIDVTCIITHASGHSEKTTMTAPADSSGSKNPVQERASTVTYLQRYTLIGALGLTTANQDDDGRQGKVAAPTPKESAVNLPEVPEGTDTTAPKPETAGKTDFEKQGQLYIYLCEITGLTPDKSRPLTNAEGVKFSAELVELTKFDEKPEGESSLRNLKGKWLNTAIGKAKAKLGHATPKDELLKLLQTPSLLKVLEAATINAMVKEAKGKNFKEEDCKKQILVVKGFIADAEKE